MSIILLCLIIIILVYFLRIYFKGGQCKTKHSLEGKVIIVTGASAGIGKESALDLAKHGAQVILACRNEAKTNEAMKSLSDEEKKLVKFIHCDLCDFNSIIEFANKVRKEYNKIDILMNNAGLYTQNYVVTKDNMESLLQGNFVGHVLLTFLLFDLLDKNEARIINLSSLLHPVADYKDNMNIKEMYDLKKNEEKYYSNPVEKGILYSNTKLLMIYFSKFLRKICSEKYNYIKSAAVNPGPVHTEFLRFKDNNLFLGILYIIINPILRLVLKTAVDGAQTQLNLCYIPFNEFISGGYYSDCKLTKVANIANDMEKCMKIMKLTINEIKQRFPETKIFDVLEGAFDNK